MSDYSRWRWLWYILGAAVIAGCFAAAPFWVRGLPFKWAELASLAIFPCVLVFLIVAMIREK